MRASSSEPNTLRPSSSAIYMPLDSMRFSSRGCTSDPPDFGKIRSRGKHSDTIQSPPHGFLIVLPEIAKRHSHRVWTHHGAPVDPNVEDTCSTRIGVTQI